MMQRCVLRNRRLLSSKPSITPSESQLQSLIYERGSFQVLDQLKVPYETTFMPIADSGDAWVSIRDMNVRGAPLIAMVAALGLAVEVGDKRDTFDTAEAAAAFLLERLDYLRSSRPTAVNLFEAADRLGNVVQETAKTATSAAEVIDRYIDEAEAMLAKDVADNRAIGLYGMQAILEDAGSPDGVQVLTHCNTGSLATAGYGTALGVIRALQEEGKLNHVFMTETRPYNQGARLTAFEVVAEGMPGTLVTDSMAAALMAGCNSDAPQLHAVVTGADRVVANGDTANKIGTYQLAILAKFHKVPFYIASPFTTLDCDTSTGADIHIEDRPADELTHVFGQRLAAPGIDAWNPSFDVAPAELISGIITEHGVIRPETNQVTGEIFFDVPGFVAGVLSKE
jgi:S-methyl-5-thioribose-1-phosphate isomerase